MPRHGIHQNKSQLVLVSSFTHLSSFPRLDTAILEVLDRRSRQQLLLKADGDEVALQVDRRRVEAPRPVNAVVHVVVVIVVVRFVVDRSSSLLFVLPSLVVLLLLLLLRSITDGSSIPVERKLYESRQWRLPRL